MRSFIKKIITVVVDAMAQAKDFTFPNSFIWPWKVEYLFETYESETTLFFKKNIKKGMVVLDVGANIGYFTRIFSNLVGRTGTVYAFEPDEENFVLLSRNTQGRTNVQLLKEAASDLVGYIDFYHVEGMTGTHTTLDVPHSIKSTVVANTVDNFLKSRGVLHVDFIKVDVEGAEDKVFAGMRALLTAKNPPTIIFEYTPDTSKTLFEELRKKYALYAINKDGSLSDIDNLNFRKGKRLYVNVVLRVV